MRVFVNSIVISVLSSFLFSGYVSAQCLPEMVNAPGVFRTVAVNKRTISADSPGRISVEWFGHSFFRFVSPAGTRVVADPFGPGLGYSIPFIQPHVITIGREHPHHNSVEIAGGDPLILRGLGGDGGEWAKIHRMIGDVLVFNVPVTQRTYEARTKGSAFVFEMGGLCIAHLGDVSEPLTPSQLRYLGKIHIALVPIGGMFTAGPEDGRKIVEQIRPHIAIPMHFWNDEGILRQFLQGAQRVKRMNRNSLFVSKPMLPQPTLIVVMKQKNN